MDTNKKTVSEMAVLFMVNGGHNHDGVNSALIDPINFKVTKDNLDAELINLFDNIPKVDIAPTPTPINIKLSSSINSDGTAATILVSWEMSDIPNPIAHYVVEYQRVSDNFSGSVHATGFNIAISGLEPATAYRVRVTAQSNLNKSEPSAWYQIITARDEVPPSAPTGIAAEVTLHSVFVTWTDNSEADMAGFKGQYETWLATDSVFTTPIIVKGKMAMASFSGLTTGTQYWARVRAIDLSGNPSAWSTSVTATPGQIQTPDITNLAITNAKLGDLAIELRNMSPGSVTSTVIADGSITTPKIVAGSITTALIQANAITANEIAADSISSNKIQADAITSNKIAAGAITATKIATDAITADKILAGTITASKIATGSLTSASGVFGSISANDITTGTLSAIAINIGGGTFTVSSSGIMTALGATVTGNITANAIVANASISSPVIVGGSISATAIVSNSFQTVSSGARVRMGDALTAADEVQFIGSSGGIGSIRNAQFVLGYSNSMRFSAGGIIDLYSDGTNRIDITAAGRIQLNGPVYADVIQPNEVWLQSSVKSRYLGTNAGRPVFGVNSTSNGNAEIWAYAFAQGGGGYNTISWRFLKTDIEDWNFDGLEVINRLRFREFTWIETEERDSGFISDEVPDEIASDAGWSVGALLLHVARSVQQLDERLKALGG
jgi:hypothetical protein